MKHLRTHAILLTISAFLFVISCKKDESAKLAEILSYSITSQQEVKIDKSEHTVKVVLPETVTAPGSMIADFKLSEGATATINGVAQVSRQTPNNFGHPLIYKVKSEDQSNIVDWTVTATNNSYTLNYGLGQFVSTGKSLARSYEWYLDQFSTGTHKLVNCGPTSTTMAAKWSNQAFSRTPEDARAAYRPTGGWWYTDDIHNYLSDNSIPHRYEGLGYTAESTNQKITGMIDAGNIVILCLDMYYIRSETNTDFRIDKFYNTSAAGWGHFIVVKGYKTVDNELYYEVYDPYSNNNKYTDQSLKGKNRYYRSSDIYSATSIWWNYSIVVSPTGTKGGEMGLDPSTVPSAWGQ